MQRYRLSVAGLMAGLAMATGVAVWLFLTGRWPWGCMALIAVGSCAAALWHLQSQLIHTMSAFVSALEMNDSTLRVNAGGDEELRKMTEAMNRISELYRGNLRELETRKLYYDRILKIMTHEMRNGITPVIAITSDMADHPERYQGEALVEVASLMHGQTDGIRRFLDSYYTLTHLPEPCLEAVTAGEYFRSLRNIVSTELRQRGLDEDVVGYTVPEDMPLMIDCQLMTQVMVNLIRNALDALPEEGGKVEVVATVSDARPILSVTDNGCGIPEDVVPNLFQPFYTTKPEGSGVGLSLSRQIVRRHGGELLLKSLPGKGTTVTVTL